MADVHNSAIEGVARVIGAARVEDGAGRSPDTPPAPAAAWLRARERLRLRLVRPARGVSRGAVIGMPAVTGHAAEIGVIAANALPDHDVWAFSIHTMGRRLSEDLAWVDCAREIADQLLLAESPRPCAFIGFSLAGWLGWAVDRCLVAAGRPPTPVINFDGAMLTMRAGKWRERILSLLPALASAAGTNMLLPHLGSPGNFRLPDPMLNGWAAAGITPLAVPCRTLDHVDLISPTAVAAASGALAEFVETGRAAGAARLETFDFDTSAGLLFRMLDAAAPPDRDMVRRLVEAEPMPRDGVVRLALLFLAVASGEGEMALRFACGMLADQPSHRGAIYVVVGLLAKLGRRDEAVAVAEQWGRTGKPNRELLARIDRTPDRPTRWGQMDRMTLGHDPSLDFALDMTAARSDQFSSRPRPSARRGSCPA